jgi:hypothetical protein
LFDRPKPTEGCSASGRRINIELAAQDLYSGKCVLIKQFSFLAENPIPRALCERDSNVHVI